MAPNTKETTRRAPRSDGSTNRVVVVELWRSQLAPAPTSRNLTAGPVRTAPMAEVITGTCGMMFPSYLLPKETVLRSLGVLLLQVSSRVFSR